MEMNFGVHLNDERLDHRTEFRFIERENVKLYGPFLWMGSTASGLEPL